MSLNWDISKIADFENVCTITLEKDDPNRGAAGTKVMNPITNALIWATMTIGVAEITEKTIDTFFERLRLVETLYGSMLTTSTGDRIITRAEVEQHMGLRTNAVPAWSDKKFYDHLLTLARNSKVFTDIEPKEEKAA
jgi:hypothetical protein